MKEFTERTLKSDKRMHRMTGLNLTQFLTLTQALKLVWKKDEEERMLQCPRKRAPGAGRPSGFKIEDMLLLTLIYYRHYIVQELIAEFFVTDQSSISRIISRLQPLIEEAADPMLKGFFDRWKAENKDKPRVSREEFKQNQPELWQIATDATDTEINRPGKNTIQKQYYSGKRKTHSIKTQITVSVLTERILHVSESHPGSVHDKTVLDSDGIIQKTSEQTAHFLDLGYQGVVDEHPAHYLILPPKKRPQKELSTLDKEVRKATARIRVKSEHGIRRIKIYRICSSVYRGRLPKFNQAFRNVAALHNFKLANPASIITKKAQSCFFN